MRLASCRRDCEQILGNQHVPKWCIVAPCRQVICTSTLLFILYHFGDAPGLGGLKAHRHLPDGLGVPLTRRV